MKKTNTPGIKLVITAALKKEIPEEWFSAHNVPVRTLASLKAGALKGGPGMLIVITGHGLDASREAACWIRDNLSPLFVVNIGTCGIRDKRHSLGEWVSPRSAANEEGECMELDPVFPLPHNEKITPVASLLSVRNVLDEIPEAYDAADMECFAQADVFAGTGISFHCLKFATDYSDSGTVSDFSRNLELFREEIKKLLSLTNQGDIEGSDISVVIPVYNREGTIRRAVDSVLSQSVLPKEIIVVDDSSTDGTYDILKSYGDNAELNSEMLISSIRTKLMPSGYKISLIRLPENSGPSRARNEGIKRAKTEWVAFLDSDDCWEEKKIENQIAYLKKYPFYRIMQSEEKWIRNGKRVNPRSHHKKPDGWIWERSLERCLVSPSAALARKKLLEEYGMFDEDMPACEDYDLWLKISRHHPVGLDPVMSVVKYGGHAGQLSRKYTAMDRFRAESLYRMLATEPLAEYRQKIINVLEQKLKILINGYKKRNRINDLKECEKMIASLEGCEKEGSLVIGNGKNRDN